jgi:hypothetical protein
MTTDATKTSPADRFYVPPTVTPLPPVSWHFTGPVPVLDLSPLISHFEKELQRLRDQLFVEQSAARSAREALVACEERARQANADRDLADTELAESHDSYAACEERLKASEAARLVALGEANRYAVERDAAVVELERVKATMGSASTVLPALTPGTPAAVIEAYRLLVGNEPVFNGRGWSRSYNVDSAVIKWAGLLEASDQMLAWLDEHCAWR